MSSDASMMAESRPSGDLSSLQFCRMTTNTTHIQQDIRRPRLYVSAFSPKSTKVSIISIIR